MAYVLSMHTRLNYIKDLLQEEFEDINHNSQIKEEQTTQWSKEKEQKDKQRSTKHTNKTKIE